jgi:small subunit ribosomal protein S6
VTHRYEMVYIFDNSLEETNITERLERYHALLKSADNPDPVRNVNHWGTRTLAYPIKKRETGYYVVADFDADPTQLPEYERSIKLDESVIRYLLVQNEGELPRPAYTGDDDDGDDSGPARSQRKESES